MKNGMTLEEVCLRYAELTRERASLKQALADYQPPPYFNQQEINADKEDFRRSIRECRDRLSQLEREYYRLGGKGITAQDILNEIGA